MARCKYCGRKGFFLSVDSNGLSDRCSPFVISEVQGRVRVMEDSLRLAQEGKTFGTRLSRCDLLLEHAEHLLEYEEKGIPTLTPPPSHLIAQYRPYRETLILEEAQRAAEKAKAKAQVAATPTSKYNALASGLLKAQEISEASADPALISSLVADLTSSMHKAKLDGFLEAARKAEFKGNTKKAIDQYQEALFFIRNDDIPDDQQQTEIAQLEAKLRELGAE